MNSTNFPYPKINRPKTNGDKAADQRLNEVFELLSGYKDKVKPYIFTNISFAENQDAEIFVSTRVQQYLSSVLLRSLYIRNGLVDAINSRNAVSLFANLKSFIEVPAVLAYLFSLLNRKDFNKDILIDLFGPLVLGSRGKGRLRVGTYEAVNVLTMFSKLEFFLRELRENTGSEVEIDTVMTEFYDLVCNASHPNYEAHDISGTFETAKQQWRVLNPEEFKNFMVTDSAWFAPPIVLTIETVSILAKKISDHNLIKSFQILSNPLYFDQ